MTTAATSTSTMIYPARRDGMDLVVVRDGDIASYCFVCGEPVTTTITCHLRKSNGSALPGAVGLAATSVLFMVINLIQILLFAILFAKDQPAARHRRLKYGLCRKHLVKRRWLLIASPVSLVLGIALFVFVFGHIDAPVYFGLPASIGGLGCLTMCPILFSMAPGPTLRGEDEHYLRIRGGGDAFLKHYA